MSKPETTLIAKLRDCSDGWSGDAFCVSGDVAGEAADELRDLLGLLRQVAKNKTQTGLQKKSENALKRNGVKL